MLNSYVAFTTTSRKEVEVDSEIIATQPLPSDNEILAEFMDIDDQDDDIEFIDDNDELKCPEKSELLRALETLQQFSLFTSDDGYDIQSKCSSLQRTVQKHFVNGFFRIFRNFPIFGYFEYSLFRTNFSVPCEFEIAGAYCICKI